MHFHAEKTPISSRFEQIRAFGESFAASLPSERIPIAGKQKAVYRFDTQPFGITSA